LSVKVIWREKDKGLVVGWLVLEGNLTKGIVRLYVNRKGITRGKGLEKGSRIWDSEEEGSSMLSSGG